MKIRTGFVSNSSSSSFIAWIPQDVFDNMDLTPIERALADADFIGKNSKVFGINCKTIGWVDGNYGIWERHSPTSIVTDNNREAIEEEIRATGDDPNDDDTLMNEISESLYSLQNKIIKLPKDSRLHHSEDF